MTVIMFSMVMAIYFRLKTTPVMLLLSKDTTDLV